jgi:hypothetical protein
MSTALVDLLGKLQDDARRLKKYTPRRYMHHVVNEDGTQRMVSLAALREDRNEFSMPAHAHRVLDGGRHVGMLHEEMAWA